jgi:hypothetical protein
MSVRREATNRVTIDWYQSQESLRELQEGDAEKETVGKTQRET